VKVELEQGASAVKRQEPFREKNTEERLVQGRRGKEREGIYV
jgi:hypothetical protein